MRLAAVLLAVISGGAPQMPQKVRAYLDKIEAKQHEIVARSDRELEQRTREIADYEQQMEQWNKIEEKPLIELRRRIKSGEWRAEAGQFKNRNKSIARIEQEAKAKQVQLSEQIRKAKHAREQFSEEHAAAQEGPAHLVLMPGQFQVGDIGILACGQSQPYGVSIRAVQVVDDDEVLAVLDIGPKRGKSFLIRGVPTKGMAHDAPLWLPQVFEVSGTHTYETVGGGTNTVFVLEPIELSMYLPGERERLAAAQQRRLDRYKGMASELVARLFAVGQVGRLRGGKGTGAEFSVRAVQVTGPQEMLAVVVRTSSIRGEELSSRFLIRGVSTEGIVDGATVQLPQTFKVTGTHRYQTVAGGSRTVFVLTPMQ